jgi:hypothetical protein
MKFINISGIKITMRGILKFIFTILFLLLFRENNQNTFIFWMCYMLSDSLIEKLFENSIFRKTRIPGLSVEKGHFSKLIFTLMMCSLITARFNITSLLLWGFYLVFDLYGERIAKEKWTKEIGVRQ